MLLNSNIHRSILHNRKTRAYIEKSLFILFLLFMIAFNSGCTAPPVNIINNSDVPIGVVFDDVEPEREQQCRSIIPPHGKLRQESNYLVHFYSPQGQHIVFKPKPSDTYTISFDHDNQIKINRERSWYTTEFKFDVSVTLFFSALFFIPIYITSLLITFVDGRKTYEFLVARGYRKKLYVFGVFILLAIIALAFMAYYQSVIDIRHETQIQALYEKPNYKLK